MSYRLKIKLYQTRKEYKLCHTNANYFRVTSMRMWSSIVQNWPHYLTQRCPFGLSILTIWSMGKYQNKQLDIITNILFYYLYPQNFDFNYLLFCFRGFLNCIAKDGTVYDTTKYGWLQGRQVWTYCKLYTSFERFRIPEILEAAIKGNLKNSYK